MIKILEECFQQETQVPCGEVTSCSRLKSGLEGISGKVDLIVDGGNARIMQDGSQLAYTCSGVAKECLKKAFITQKGI